MQDHGEPTVGDALKWFPHQPGAFTFVGWKEHLFEFLVTHCGDLVLAHDAFAEDKQVTRHAGSAAHFFFLWGLGTGTEFPPLPLLSPHVMDDGSCRQELADGWRPTVVTRRSLTHLAVDVKQTVFAHRPGGGSSGAARRPSSPGRASRSRIWRPRYWKAATRCRSPCRCRPTLSRPACPRGPT